MPQESAPSETYELDPQTRVYSRRSGLAPFAYNDGDEVEERLLRVVSAASDLSVLSLELASQIRDWPSRYHLSATRANLLRPLQPLLRGRILEIGAGCGAVTRYLGECGAEVVAVEGSYRRACVAAARCRDLPNVRVICDRFEDYPASERFDVVTLIGVLEWVRLFGTSEDPVQTVLERTRGLLHEQGSLLLAIENQLGLKYFAGYVEDHTCVPMLGIDDLYDARSPVTFGRGELTRRLRAAGYPESELFVPLPDYKLPVAVVTPAGLDDEGWQEARASIVSAAVGADPQQLPVPLFSLEKAFRTISRNGLVPDLANSFLIRASTTAPERRSAVDGVLAVSYATGRRPEFAKQTSIERRDGRLVVRRRRLAPGVAAGPALPIHLRDDDEPFRSGRLWTDALCDIVNRPGWMLEDLAGWTRLWVAALASEGGVSAADARALLPGRWLDATPYNLIEGANGELHFIDLEWETEQPLELGFLVWRGLYSSLNKLRTVAVPATGAPRRYWDAVAGHDGSAGAAARAVGTRALHRAGHPDPTVGHGPGRADPGGPAPGGAPGARRSARAQRTSRRRRPAAPPRARSGPHVGEPRAAHVRDSPTAVRGHAPGPRRDGEAAGTPRQPPRPRAHPPGTGRLAEQPRRVGAGTATAGGGRWARHNAPAAPGSRPRSWSRSRNGRRSSPMPS